jgi:hypothetical protein
MGKSQLREALSSKKIITMKTKRTIMEVPMECFPLLIFNDRRPTLFIYISMILA